MGAADRAPARWATVNELARRAIERGVAFVPGAPFCANPDVSTLRLSFAQRSPTRDRHPRSCGVARLAQALTA